MFTSPASSHSNNGIFGSPSMFAQVNQNGDAFGSPTATGMSNNRVASTWSFGQTSSPLTFGGPSSYGFGSSTSVGRANTTGSRFDLKQPHFGCQERGSRIQNYKKTPETEYIAEKLVSISAMPVYKDKSHDELKWEDYKFTKEGGFGFGLGSSYSAEKKPTSSGLSPFSSSPVSTNIWGTTSPMKPNPFGKSFQLVPPKWSFSGPTSQPLTCDSPSLSLSPLNHNQMSSSSYSGSTFAPFTRPTSPSSSKSFLSTPVAGPFTSPANSMGSGFCTSCNQPRTHNYNGVLYQPSSSKALSPSANTSSTLGASTSPSWSLAPLSQTPFTSMTSSSFSSPTLAPFTLGASSSSGLWPTSIGPMVTAPVKSVLDSTSNQPTTLSTPSTQNHNGEITGVNSNSIDQPLSAATPFGILPPKPHLSFQSSQSTTSVHYGISSIPVKEKPAPVRHSLLTTSHLYRRSKLPIRKYDPKLHESKVPYFSVTKENPKELVISRNIREKIKSDNIYENDKDDIKAYTSSNDRTEEKNNLPSKLQLPDYYTTPEISELESKEKVEPGYCSHVKDFLIGRHGYGSIKFLEETDVRDLEIESCVQFNNREVIVYMDESKKPPVGQGLNKPAEITLLNIKCIDKRSGVELKDGLKVDKYREMLKKKVVAQGGEFVSYDPVEGEWKFRVQHF